MVVVVVVVVTVFFSGLREREIYILCGSEFKKQHYLRPALKWNRAWFSVEWENSKSLGYGWSFHLCRIRTGRYIHTEIESGHFFCFYCGVN